MARTNQRFMSFYHGQNHVQMVKMVFNNGIIIQIAICIILCGGIATLTNFIIEHFLNIPLENHTQAKLVYIIMLVSLFFNLLSAPFYATLIAHENIVYSSIIQTIDAVLKIPIAISLFYIETDKLVFYTLLICGVNILNFFCYAIYSIRKYPECKRINIYDFNWKLSKEMCSFTLWAIYGTFCVVGRTQGIAIVLNRFFSTAINAAYGIGNQVIGQLSFLSVALTTAINPQIVKAEGARDRIKVFRLAEISSKYSLLLISIILIPVYTNIELLLSLWLKEVPPFTTVFCRWIIIITLIDWTTQNLNSVNSAIGNVKYYNIITGTIILSTVPIAYFTLSFLSMPVAAMIVYASICILVSLSRLIFLSKYDGLSFINYVKNVFNSVIPILSINFFICCELSTKNNLCLFFISCLLSLIITLGGSLLICMQPDEKLIISSLLKKLKNKI
ncbi:MAG: hypothetical protein NC453_31000 [Muribaculum sp.]|nr:hypothetical protein [Muribaculum sp.]